MLPILIITLSVLFFVFLFLGLYRHSPRFALEKRIEQVKTSDDQTAEEVLSKPFVQRVLLPVGGAVTKLLRWNMPTELSERTQKRLVMAGLYPRVTVAQLMGLCLISAPVFAVLMLISLLSMSHASAATLFRDPLNLVLVGLGAVIGYLFPQFVLSRRVRSRQEEILLTLPYAIDILSISVEAGMGFDAGVGYTMRKLRGPLAEEFAKTLNEIRLGKPRLEALEDLGNRTGVDELKTFITAVVHASRLGGSITNTLRVQADSIRVRRRQRAQEAAMKAPVKMVFPLVLFIFPALFFVIIGPAALSIYYNFLTK